MAENPELNKTVELWAKYTIKEWVKKAAALNISPVDPINASRFVHHIITNSNGNPEKIQFIYDYYLNFVDWGVGRGVTLKHRDMLVSSGATTRRKRPWFTDVFYHEIRRLTAIVAEKYALKSAYILIQTSSEKGID